MPFLWPVNTKSTKMKIKWGGPTEKVNTMEEKEIPNVLVMAIILVTRNDVLSCAEELGISPEKLTRDVIYQVQEAVSKGLVGWKNTVKYIIKEAIKEKGMECPLGMTCSPACNFSQVGDCSVPEGG